MTPEAALRRIVAAVREAALVSDAAAARAIDESVNITGSKASSAPPPGAFAGGGESLGADVAAYLGRVAQGIEKQVAVIRNGAEVPARSREGLKDRILEAYAGRGANEVAFVEAVDQTYVEKTRRAAGLRSQDGRPQRGGPRG